MFRALNNQMSVIGSYVDHNKVPTVMFTNFPNCVCDNVTAFGIEFERSRSQGRKIMLPPLLARLDKRFSIDVIKAVNGASAISVKPGAISAEGYEKCYWFLCIVPHTYPSAHADGTDLSYTKQKTCLLI